MSRTAYKNATKRIAKTHGEEMIKTFFKERKGDANKQRKELEKEVAKIFEDSMDKVADETIKLILSQKFLPQLTSATGGAVTGNITTQLP